MDSSLALELRSLVAADDRCRRRGVTILSAIIEDAADEIVHEYGAAFTLCSEAKKVIGLLEEIVSGDEDSLRFAADLVMLGVELLRKRNVWPPVVGYGEDKIDIAVIVDGWYNRYLHTNNDDSHAWFGLARLYHWFGKEFEAGAALERALRHNPGDVRVLSFGHELLPEFVLPYLKAYVIFCERKDWKVALQKCVEWGLKEEERAIFGRRVSKDFSCEPYAVLGSAWLDLGKKTSDVSHFVEAKDWYEQAYRISPNNDSVNVALEVIDAWLAANVQ